MKESGTLPDNTEVQGQVSNGPWWIRARVNGTDQEIGYLYVGKGEYGEVLESFRFKSQPPGAYTALLWEPGVHYIADKGPEETPGDHPIQYIRKLGAPCPLPSQPVVSSDYNYDFFDLIGKQETEGAIWSLMGIRAIHRQDPTHRYTFQFHWNPLKQSLMTVPSRVDSVTIKLFTAPVWRREG